MATAAPENRIAFFRQAQGLSLRQLSLRLDPSGDGPDPRTINRWERGETGVPDTLKPALAEIFGVTISYLMGWENLPSERESAAA